MYNIDMYSSDSMERAIECRKQISIHARLTRSDIFKLLPSITQEHFNYDPLVYNVISALEYNTSAYQVIELLLNKYLELRKAYTELVETKNTTII